MLHDGSDGDRHDGDDGRDEEGGIHIVKDGQCSLLPGERQSNPCSLTQRREINLAHCHSCNIADHHTQQNGNNPNDTFTTHTGKNHRCQRHNSQRPVGSAVLNSTTREHQTDGDNHGASNQWREEAQHLLDAKCLNESCHQKIAHSGKEHTDAGIVQGQRLAHALLYAQRLHRHIAPQEGKRGAQEGRHLQLAD